LFIMSILLDIHAGYACASGPKSVGGASPNPSPVAWSERVRHQINISTNQICYGSRHAACKLTTAANGTQTCRKESREEKSSNRNCRKTCSDLAWKHDMQSIESNPNCKHLQLKGGSWMEIHNCVRPVNDRLKFLQNVKSEGVLIDVSWA
jgi:hypothetical protein